MSTLTLSRLFIERWEVVGVSGQEGVSYLAHSQAEVSMQEAEQQVALSLIVKEEMHRDGQGGGHAGPHGVHFSGSQS